jgi:radical SAM protein with 4Fe4S-binding SPASM domain
VHCYWGEYGANADPTLEQIEGILRKFKKLGRHFRERGRHILTIGGGEPLVRPDLDRIIALSVRRGFKVRLVTNATILDPARALELKKAGLKIAQVSLEGACEQTHDLVRGRGNWTRTMQGIESLKQAGVFVVLSYVLLPGINMDEAPLLLDLARRLKVAGVKYARPVREGQAVIHNISVQGDYHGTFQRILDHANKIRYRRLLMFFDPLAHLLPIEEPVRTKGLWGLATDLCQCDNTELIEVNGGSGDIYYCRIRATLGNIWKDDLVKLWQSHPILVGIRRKEAGGACKGCSVWSACRGGCPAVTYGNTGATLVQDTDCHRVQEQGVAPLPFSGRGIYSVPMPTVKASIRNLGVKLRDMAYWMVLK